MLSINLLGIIGGTLYKQPVQCKHSILANKARVMKYTIVRFNVVTGRYSVTISSIKCAKLRQPKLKAGLRTIDCLLQIQIFTIGSLNFI